MRRRQFLAVLCGATAWPAITQAQQGTPVIGYLNAGQPDGRAHLAQAFRIGLSEFGYVEGRNVTIESFWANDDPRRFREMADELVRRKVAVIVTPIGTSSAVAAKAATSSIPIVFSTGTDAVKAGLIASYNRPGGNMTGVGGMVSELGAKRFALLHELQPQMKRVGLLSNPNNPLAAENNAKDINAAAMALGVELETAHARSGRELDVAFATLADKQCDAIIISPDPLVGSHRTQLAILAARYRIPTMFPLKDFAVVGGLIAYGPDDGARYRLLGNYAARILKGEKPAEMPVQQPTVFQLVINMQTARALGIAVPATLLARADEVIE